MIFFLSAYMCIFNTFYEKAIERQIPPKNIGCTLHGKTSRHMVYKIMCQIYHFKSFTILKVRRKCKSKYAAEFEKVFFGACSCSCFETC